MVDKNNAAGLVRWNGPAGGGLIEMIPLPLELVGEPIASCHATLPAHPVGVAGCSCDA